MGPLRLRGFTLIELLVVLGIITIVSSIVLASQSNFNKTLILSNTAYDVGLSIRDAEIYGIASRATPGAITNSPYGVDFSTGSTNSFIFFADTNPAVPDDSTPDVKPGNGVYDTQSNPPDQLIQTYTLGNGITIGDFCAYPASGAPLCASSGGLDTLDIVFARPNTSASIRGALHGVASGPFASACLTIKASATATRLVRVTAVGAVDLPASCP